MASKATGVGGGGNTSGSYWSFKGKTDRVVVEWKEHNFPLYDLRVRAPDKKDAPPNNDRWHYVDQHPGKYECKVMADGQIVGSFAFEVADGRIVPHPCQSDLNTTDNVYVIPFEDRGMTREKTDKSVQKRAFFGQTKGTAEFEACWDFKVACDNGATLEAARTCSTV